MCLYNAFNEAEIGCYHLVVVAQQQVFGLMDQRDLNEQKCPDD